MLSPRGGKLFGGREAIGRPFEEICSAPELDELRTAVREAFVKQRSWTSERVHTRIEDADGQATDRVFVFTVVPNREESGKAQGVVVYAEDVTERHFAEDERARERFRLMIEHSDLALALFDGRSRALLVASPKYASILRRTVGLGPEEAVGQPWENVCFMAPLGEAAAVFHEIVHRGTAQHVREVRVPGGAEEPDTVWDCSLLPVHQPDRGVAYVLATAVEMTEQVRAREDLVAIDHIKDELLSLASHELRTPLVPLSAYLDMTAAVLREKPGTEKLPRAEELIDKARGQLRYIERLTDDLLDVSRLESGRFPLEEKPLDLGAVVRRAAEQAALLAPSPPIRTEVPDREVRTVGDEGRLLQATLNLLVHAQRHARESPAIELRLSAEGGAAAIEVRDRGPGIAAEELGLLFQRFRQGGHAARPPRGGLGLGLYITRGIVERHGGSIAVSSKVGEGSTFRIELPLREPPEEEVS